MNTWYAYRSVWSAHPWVLVVAVLAVAMLVLGIVGTVTGSVLALFFIPGLAAVFGHHLIVTKQSG